MTEKLVSVCICEQWAVIQFLNIQERNENYINERLSNMYTKAIIQSNVYEWIKKFNEGCTELHKALLGQQSDLVNKEIRRIVCSLLDNDHCRTISDLYQKIAAQGTYVNVSQMSIYQILTTELEMIMESARWVL